MFVPKITGNNRKRSEDRIINMKLSKIFLVGRIKSCKSDFDMKKKPQ